MLCNLGGAALTQRRVILLLLYFLSPFCLNTDMQKWLQDNWLSLVAALMLLGALTALPYVYYQLLNWVVLGAAVVTAYRAHNRKRETWMWIFIVIAVVFNPVAPLHLRPSDWRLADIVAALLFFVSLFMMRREATEKTSM